MSRSPSETINYRAVLQDFIKTALPRKKLAALEKVFGAEIVGRLPFRSRAKIYQELCEDGLLEPMEKHYGGAAFPVAVRGYQLTHAGRFAYCSSCGEAEMEDRDF